MGDLAKVNTYVPDEDGAPGCDVSFTEDGLDEGIADLYQPACIDAPPLPGDTACCVDTTDESGESAILGFSGPGMPAKAAPGEGRFFARAPSGELMAEIWAYGDGTVVAQALPDLPGGAEMVLAPDGSAGLTTPTASVELEADGTVSLGNLLGSIVIQPDGTVVINGVSINLLGIVSATNVTTPTANLNLHTHTVLAVPNPVGPPIPTNPPTPTP